MTEGGPGRLSGGRSGGPGASSRRGRMRGEMGDNGLAGCGNGKLSLIKRILMVLAGIGGCGKRGLGGGLSPGDRALGEYGGIEQDDQQARFSFYH